MQNKMLKAILGVMSICIVAVILFMQLTVQVPVLNADAKAGDIIPASQISNAKVFKWDVKDDVILKATDIVKNTATRAISKNTLITKDMVKEESVEQIYDDMNMVVIPLPVNALNIPEDIKEGDMINVLVYFEVDSKDSAMAGISNFVAGFNETGVIEGVSKDANGLINKVDVKVNKDMASELINAASQGQIYIIRNYAENDVELLGSTLKDIYLKNFHVDNAMFEIAED